jgi:hypothetical protein
MNEATYMQWKARVDALLESQIGLSSDDLPDQNYREWFESGMTPSEAARKVMDAIEGM